MADFDLHRARTRLHAQWDALCRRMGELVRVNSHSANPDGCNEVAALLATQLAGTGMALERVVGEQVGDHCFWRSPAEGARVWLVGHHDTVFPPGSFEGYREEGDKAHGPGVIDMKGGLAMVVTVLEVLAEQGALERLPLGFACVADEEIGSRHSRAHLQQRVDGARAALVFEAGRGEHAVIVARRGSGNAWVTAHGRAAHAGNALAEGRNAIWALSHFVDAAQRISDAERGTSVNVGLVQGGTARNTVPAEASCELDLRFRDAAGREAVLRGLEAAARAAEQELPGTQLEVRFEVSREPWVATDATLALADAYLAEQRALGLGGERIGPVGGGSDANTIAPLGVPVIDGLGAYGTGFHTPEETVHLDVLMPRTEALLGFLAGLLRDT